MDGEASVHIAITEDARSQEAGADEILRVRAGKSGHRLALTDSPDRRERELGEPRRLTYARMNSIASKVAVKFAQSRLAEGQVIALQLPNTVEAVPLLLGAWRAGLVPCLLPLHWKSHEIEKAFSRVNPQAVVTVSRYGEDRPAMTMGLAAAKTMSIRHVFAFGDGIPDGITPLDECLTDTEDTIEEGDKDHTPSNANPDDIALLTWSVTASGIHPVPRTHAQLMALVRMFTHRMTVTKQDVVLNCYPCTGIVPLAGSILAPLTAGAEVALHLPFDFDLFRDQLHTQDITCASVPPSVVAALERAENLRSGDLALSRLGCVWPTPHAVSKMTSLFEPSVPLFDIHNFHEFSVMVQERETGADPALLPLGKLYIEDDPEGEPLLETRIRGSVSSTEERQVLKGNLKVRGSTVPSGPFEADKERANGESWLTPDAQGFLDTGIPCTTDETLGKRFRCLKSRDLIYHGGAIVSATELDSLYGDFPEFLDAAAFTLEDAVMGERIFAAVVPRPDHAPSLERLNTFLADRKVAAHKSPDQLVIVKSIPRSSEGVVLRDQILSQL